MYNLSFLYRPVSYNASDDTLNNIKTRLTADISDM